MVKVFTATEVAEPEVSELKSPNRGMHEIGGVISG